MDKEEIESRIRELISHSKIERKIYRGREYLYLLNPITSGTAPIHPNHLNLITNLLINKIRMRDEIDYILTYEAMGIHITTLISDRLRKPFIIARKKKYMADMLEVERGSDNLYIPRDIIDSKIIIVDSIISTGETIINTIKTIAKYRVKVLGIYSFIDRLDKKGSKKIYMEVGIKPYAIVEINVEEYGLDIVRINI